MIGLRVFIYSCLVGRLDQFKFEVFRIFYYGEQDKKLLFKDFGFRCVSVVEEIEESVLLFGFVE